MEKNDMQESMKKKKKSFDEKYFSMANLQSENGEIDRKTWKLPISIT